MMKSIKAQSHIWEVQFNHPSTVVNNVRGMVARYHLHGPLYAVKISSNHFRAPYVITDLISFIILHDNYAKDAFTLTDKYNGPWPKSIRHRGHDLQYKLHAYENHKIAR